MQPAPGRPLTYAQLYIYDPQTAHDNHCSLNENLNPQTLQLLQDVLLEVNPYIQIYQHAFEVIGQDSRDSVYEVTAHLCAAPGCHPWRGNLPVADEVAVVICDSGGEELNLRDIVLHQWSGGLQIISDLHPSYSPLYYVLLFPRGESGWHPDL